MARREIRTPVADSDVIELGERVYRKQVLPHTKIHHQGRDMTFDRAYCDNIVRAFNDGSHDYVPFVFADHLNRHSMSPELARGQVLNFESAEDGLYATMRLSEDAEQIVKDNPRFGVSMRIRENYSRSDGKEWPAACQHVLGTHEPAIAGMSPWEPVDLSADPEAELIDLTNTQEGADMAPQTETDPSTLFAAFQRWYDAGQPDPGTEPDEGEQETGEDTEGEETGEEGGDQAEGETGELDIDGMSDEEFDAFAQELLADETAEADPEPEVVAASQPGDPDSLELSNTDPRVIEMSQQMTAMRSQLDASNYERERDQIVRRTGIPPHIVDLARPLLEGSGRTVDLANGSTADAGQVVRSLIDEFGKTARLLDLSETVGHLNLTDEETEAAEKRQAIAQSVIGRAGL